MDVEGYLNSAQARANQPLGGKELRFPSGGQSSLVQSSRLGVPFTPVSLNVMLRPPYNEGKCGGTRPGLKAFVGTQPTAANTGRWLWPNGDVIQWPDGDNMAFGELGSRVTMPDGSVLVNPHETFDVRASVGSVPSNCTAMAFYRDRAVVAKDAMWYASRLGAHDDFDYGADAADVAKAAYGNVALAGRSGESITALAAVADARLFVATKRSLWCFAGEVTAGLSPVSETIGIVSRDAWCWDGARLWFVGAEGLYALVPGELPALMTPHLEDTLSGLSAATLVYDPDRGGIHVFGTLGNAAYDWYYDISNKAMWRMAYPAVKRPTSGGVALLDGKSRVVFLCADGVFRYWDEDQATDDGTAIVSALALGPVAHTTGNTEDGFLAELDCDFDTEVTTQYGANVSGVVASTSNAVVGNDKTFVTWVHGGSETPSPVERFRYEEGAGWNRVVRPRVRCNAFSVVIWSRQNRWAMSAVTAVHRGCGRIRR